MSSSHKLWIHILLQGQQTFISRIQNTNERNSRTKGTHIVKPPEGEDVNCPACGSYMLKESPRDETKIECTCCEHVFSIKKNENEELIIEDSTKKMEDRLPDHLL